MTTVQISLESPHPFQVTPERKQINVQQFTLPHQVGLDAILSARYQLQYSDVSIKKVNKIKTQNVFERWRKQYWNDIEDYLAKKSIQFKRYKYNIYLLQKSALKIQHWFYACKAKQETQELQASMNIQHKRVLVVPNGMQQLLTMHERERNELRMMVAQRVSPSKSIEKSPNDIILIRKANNHSRGSGSRNRKDEFSEPRESQRISHFQAQSTISPIQSKVTTQDSNAFTEQRQSIIPSTPLMKNNTGRSSIKLQRSSKSSANIDKFNMQAESIEQQSFYHKVVVQITPQISEHTPSVQQSQQEQSKSDQSSNVLFKKYRPSKELQEALSPEKALQVFDNFHREKQYMSRLSGKSFDSANSSPIKKSPSFTKFINTQMQIPSARDFLEELQQTSINTTLNSGNAQQILQRLKKNNNVSKIVQPIREHSKSVELGNSVRFQDQPNSQNSEQRISHQQLQQIVTQALSPVRQNSQINRNSSSQRMSPIPRTQSNQNTISDQAINISQHLINSRNQTISSQQQSVHNQKSQTSEVGQPKIIMNNDKISDYGAKIIKQFLKKPPLSRSESNHSQRVINPEQSPKIAMPQLNLDFQQIYQDSPVNDIQQIAPKTSIGKSLKTYINNKISKAPQLTMTFQDEKPDMQIEQNNKQRGERYSQLPSSRQIVQSTVISTNQSKQIDSNKKANLQSMNFQMPPPQYQYNILRTPIMAKTKVNPNIQPSGLKTPTMNRQSIQILQRKKSLDLSNGKSMHNFNQNTKISIKPTDKPITYEEYKVIKHNENVKHFKSRDRALNKVRSQATMENYTYIKSVLNTQSGQKRRQLKSDNFINAHLIQQSRNHSNEKRHNFTHSEQPPIPSVLNYQRFMSPVRQYSPHHLMSTDSNNMKRRDRYMQEPNTLLELQTSAEREAKLQDVIKSSVIRIYSK